MPHELEFEVKRMTRLSGESTLKAFCDVAVADALVLKGVKVVEGKNGLFVGMPSEKGKNGQWYDTIVPLNKETKARLSGVVLEFYQAEEQQAAAR